MTAKTRTRKTAAPRFPRVDMRLYRQRLMEEVGFSPLEMDLLQLESGCRFIEHALLQVPGIPNIYTRPAELMLYEPGVGFWASWNFMFINKCARLVISWQNYEERMEVFGDSKPREFVIAAFHDMHLDDIAHAQFGDYLKRVTGLTNEQSQPQ